MIGAISSLSSPRSSGVSLSGPAALAGLRLFKSFSIPLTDMSMCGKTGVGFDSLVVRYRDPFSQSHPNLAPSSGVRLRGDLGVNTDKNCVFYPKRPKS